MKTRTTICWLTALLLVAAGLALADEEVQLDSGKVSLGKSVFGSYCTSCHGKEANGDGQLAEVLKVPPADLTVLARGNDGVFPFDRVVQKIDGRVKVRGHGSSDMPVWGDIFLEVEGGGTTEAAAEKVTALAHYLLSIQTQAAESVEIGD